MDEEYNIRKYEKSIHLICACPYDGFEQGWSDRWKETYNKILKSADLVRFISKNYNHSCFQLRNKWMVDHSARVIAVYNGMRGGTQNTIHYAQGKAEIRIIWV